MTDEIRNKVQETFFENLSCWENVL
jgi:hypothetical protein